MEGRSSRRLCIFARAPEPGRVKRRLAGTLGEAGALSAYLELVEGTLARCAEATSYTSQLWVSGGDLDHPQILDWLARYPLVLHSQTGADLGERMWRALEHSLAAGTAAVLIGTDCPDIDRRYVEHAFEQLETHDVVLGPAEDGGYGLIALGARPLPELFSDMPWGEATVLEHTLARARRSGARVSLLPTIYDVDRPVDWQRYRRLNPGPGRGSE
jgi:hypothetical protein